MTLNQSFLSEKEFFRKTARMIEHLSNTKIKLKYTRGENYCQRVSKDNYVINIATPSIIGIPKYTALIHELYHILMRSPFVKMSSLLDTWDKSRKTLYFRAFNILEDQRIESFARRDYLAYNKRFDRTLVSLGKDMYFKNKDNPINILHAIRFKNEELVKNSKNFEHYKQALNDVALTDNYGALRILISIKKYIDEYELDGNELEEEDFENLVDLSSDNIPEELQKTEYTNEEINQIKKDGKTNGKKEISKIESKMSVIPDKLSVSSVMIKENPIDVDYTINHNISKKIHNILSVLKLKEKMSVSNVGFDIDMDSYITNLINGHDMNNSFIDEFKDEGISILLSVDGSQSMIIDNNITKARNLTATLFHSVKTLKNTEVRTNLWSSNKFGKTWIRDIKTMNDSKKINVDKNYPWTPTHVALEYALYSLKEMNGKKKIVFLITDGNPMFHVNGRNVANEVYLNMCKKAYRKLINYTPNVFCILIHRGRYLGTPRMVKELFGNKVIRVDDMEEGSEKIIKQFKRIIDKDVNK